MDDPDPYPDPFKIMTDPDPQHQYLSIYDMRAIFIAASFL